MANNIGNIVLTDELLDKVQAHVCRKRFYNFVETFWGTIISEEPVFNWHIAYLCDELQEMAYYIVNRLPKPHDLIINIPPGTTKSTSVTIMFLHGCGRKTQVCALFPAPTAAMCH